MELYIFITLMVSIGAAAIYANWIRPLCRHYPGQLSVMTKDEFLGLSDDGLFEKWLCTCKCKCGTVVNQKFAFGTEKFYSWKKRGSYAKET